MRRGRHDGRQQGDPRLFDDSWIPSKSLLTKRNAELGLKGLSWPCALCWICARDEKLPAEFDAQCRATQPTILEARNKLVQTLAKAFLVSCEEVAEAVKVAEAELTATLGEGIVGSVYASGNGPGDAPIPAEAWLFVYASGTLPYDSIHDLFNEVTYDKVRIDEKELLRRWPSRRLLEIAGPRWDLRQTLYWIAHRSHQGYDLRRRLSDDEFRDSNADLLTKLRVGRLECSVSLRPGRPGLQDLGEAMEARPREFWVRCHLADVADAQLDAARIKEIWPHDANVPPEIVAKSRSAIVEYLMAKGHKRAGARKTAERLHPVATRGRRPRKSADDVTPPNKIS